MNKNAGCSSRAFTDRELLSSNLLTSYIMYPGNVSRVFYINLCYLWELISKNNVHHVIVSCRYEAALWDIFYNLFESNLQHQISSMFGFLSLLLSRLHENTRKKKQDFKLFSVWYYPGKFVSAALTLCSLFCISTQFCFGSCFLTFPLHSLFREQLLGCPWIWMQTPFSGGTCGSTEWLSKLVAVSITSWNNNSSHTACCDTGWYFVMRWVHPHEMNMLVCSPSPVIRECLPSSHLSF